VGRWAIYFALTQAIELPIYSAGMPSWPRWKRLSIAFGASALTHPWLWFVLPPLLLRRLHYPIYLALVEPAIAAVEALYLAGMGVQLRRACVLSALANSASLLAGLVLHWVLPRW
jgi:hypothetical protein